MDFLEEPEIKKKYERCKYIVKLWEHKFIKKSKRLPSRLDIKEAPSDVRNAYKKYFQLKSAALEQSFRDVDGFNDFDNEAVSSPIIQKDKSENELKSPEITTDNNKTNNEDSNTNKNVPKTVEKQMEDIFAEKNEESSYFNPDSTWGSHLNNTTSKKEETKTKDEPQNKVTSKISKKLFCGSKFNKRNPRKSLSFSQKNKSENAVESPCFLTQPMPSFDSLVSDDLTELSQEFNFENIKIVNAVEKVTSQPTQISFDTLKSKITRNVDTGWVSRVAEKSGVHIEDKFKFTRNTKLDYDSEDIIDESDEEMFQKDQSLLHVAKKSKIGDETLDRTPDSFELAEESVQNINISVQSTNVSTKIVEKVDIVTKISNKVEEIEIETPKKQNDTSDEKLVKTVRKSTKKSLQKQRSIKKVSKTKKNEVESEIISPRRSERRNKVKASFLELNSSEEDPFHSDNDEKDPEFDPKGDNLKKKFGDIFEFQETDTLSEDTPNKKSEGKKSDKQSKTHQKIGKNKSKESSNDTNETENEPYELEFNVKPRIVAPRFNNIKKMLSDTSIEIKSTKSTKNKNENDCKQPKDKRQQEKDKFLDKLQSGNLNDNFVTINLKKKIFARGKSGRNFSKWKKNEWKNKKKALYGPDMDMTGCDGGMLTCFKCGQIGHFARQCKNTKGDGLLPIQASESVEEECSLPTLEEASRMARENVQFVRKPTKELNEQSNNENIDNYVENSDDYEAEDEEDCFDDEESQILLAEALKIEEHVKKLDVMQYIDRVKFVEPFYKLNEDNSVIDTTNEVYEALYKFGHTSFRNGQEKAIMRILSGQSTLLTLSTGSGKSLCYQLPAYLYSQRAPCISLVISPLVSLMEDQVSGIPKFLRAACLHTNQTKTQREKIIEALSVGELSILLISPEALVAGEKQSGFGSIFRKLPPISFACIDEAHCVSQWSHNFRPSYLLVSRILRESLGVKTILGLTATATRATEDSIIDHIGIPDGRNGIISDVPLPNNLILSVSKDRQRDAALIALLLSDKFKKCKSIIVYCTRRDECERVATFLRTSLKEETPIHINTNKKRKRLVNVQAEPYHAGMSASRRKSIQNKFMSGELRIVVATVAFGMGINKSDIRSVIHFNMPSSFESYVQEIGRAGRDGLDAFCHLFLDSEGHDENELKRHIHSNSIDRHVIRKLLQKVFVPCSCKGVCPKHEVAFSIEETVRSLDIPEENISTLLCYLELHKNKYIELLSPAYTTCKVISYGGPLQIRKMSKECPPLAMALALHKSQTGDDPNLLEFPVVDIAAAMGWESGICKHKLKNLEWTSVNGQPRRSTLSVQFSNLGFRMLSPGNLGENELDETLDSLYSRVVDQERKALKQLHAVHKLLVGVAKPSFKVALSDEEESQSSILKEKIREYFNSPDPLSNVLEDLPQVSNEEQLVNDVKTLVCMYRDNQFTGKAVARIFQGIQSPNFPAVIWKKCRFWRSHLADDFHEICRIATREIIKLR